MRIEEKSDKTSKHSFVTLRFWSIVKVNKRINDNHADNRTRRAMLDEVDKANVLLQHVTNNDVWRVADLCGSTANIAVNNLG